MAQNQKSYDNEFKAQVVKLAQEIGGHKAANELGIPKGTMYTWIKVFKEGRLSANEAAYGWRRRGTDRHDSGSAAFRSVRLSESCRSGDSDRAAKAACYIVRCRQSPQLAIFCALWQVHMLEVWRRTAV